MDYKILIDASDRLNKKIVLYKDNDEFDRVFGDIDSVVALEALLAKHDLKLEDIKTYESFLGPGSFTGLKTGVTIVNIINWALGRIAPSEIVLPEYGGEPNIF